MEMKTKSWLQVGVELEGSWWKKKEDVAALVRGAVAVKDDSVHIGQGFPGEIYTRPHDTLEAVLEDVDKLWPDVVDDSCGLHVHTSFSPIQVSLLAERDFFRFYLDEWAKWGKENDVERTHVFWVRLRGDNKFTTLSFVPEKQLTGQKNRTREERYTMLNFYAWEKHRTLESRLLPMFSNKALAISAIKKTLEIYDTYLQGREFPVVSYKSPLDTSTDLLQETYNLKIPDRTPREYEAKGTFPHLPRGPEYAYAIEGAMDMMLPWKTDTGKTTP